MTLERRWTSHADEVERKLVSTQLEGAVAMSDRATMAVPMMRGHRDLNVRFVNALSGDVRGGDGLRMRGLMICMWMGEGMNSLLGILYKTPDKFNEQSKILVIN